MNAIVELLNPKKLSFNISNPPTKEAISSHILDIKKTIKKLTIIYPLFILFAILLPMVLGNIFPSWLLIVYFLLTTCATVYVGFKFGLIFTYLNSLLDVKSDEYSTLTVAISKSSQAVIKKTVANYLSKTISNRNLTFHEYNQLINILIKGEEITSTSK